MANDMAEVCKLLTKIYFEVRDLRAELRKRAGEPEPAKKPSVGGVTSVTRSTSGVHVNETSELPTALTPEQQEAMRAQRPGYKEIARTERVRAADDTPAIRVPQSIARNFGARRDVLTTRDIQR